jgi:hypothetical protein
MPAARIIHSHVGCSGNHQHGIRRLVYRAHDQRRLVTLDGDGMVLDRSTTRRIFRPSESFSPDMPDINLQKHAIRLKLLHRMAWEHLRMDRSVRSGYTGQRLGRDRSTPKSRTIVLSTI